MMARVPNKTNTRAIDASDKKRIKLSDTVTISDKQHAALSLHIRDRLVFGNTSRDEFVDRYSMIAKELAGFIILDDDDKEREKDNEKGKGPKVTDFNLALTLMQMDELVTYLLEVLVPDEGMYKAIAPVSQQDIAKGFSRVMNEHGSDFNHYGNYARGLMSALVYNLGAWGVEWEEVEGNVFRNNIGGNFDLTKEVVKMGNAVNSIDVYNFLYDRSVPFRDLATQGEFFATVDLKRKFRIEKDEADGKIFGIDRFINNLQAAPNQRTAGNPIDRYYRFHPEVFRDHSGKQGRTNWIDLLSVGTIEDLGGAVEEVTINMWITPSTYGLSDSKELEIWRFVYMQDEYVVSARHLDNAHAMLPIAVTQPWPEEDTSQEKSHAEYLLPLQRFASHQMNIHQRANRKALWGTTVYDKDAISLGPEEGFAGGAIPADLGRSDRDVRKAVQHFTDGPETQQTMGDVANIVDLMQKLFPTDTANQVASLERATKYQAAATVQAGNRRHKKLAKIIDQDAFVPIRNMMMYNIYQFQDSIEVFEEGGEVQTIEPAQFRDSKLRFTVSDGLKGIDKLLIIEMYGDILQMVLQSQVAIEQIDIIKMIDYITSISGDYFDFDEFRVSHPLDNQPKEVKDAAMQALQMVQQAQAGGAGAAPAGAPNGAGPPV